ncbi:microcystin degradation protein MlrC [Halomonas sp. 141]|uniref:M81 family metallopeptidase n=1 Tax=Halomonas sp. 141 TaxID=2056666 RepID=UPI000C2AFCDD|nr:M81 family metallopeptidase [Halomonas sp. 141]PJX13503.1 microcystin degradation protein MlrC [Halomonas sp. 141]
MKILIAGFQHETNTFAPTKAVYESFVQGGGFPALCRDEALLELEKVNIPIGGFITAALAEGHQLLPVIWAAASPSAHVTKDAFERIAGEITLAASSDTFDAIYLDLHGAMVCEHLADGEGELLARLREIVGSELPIVASLDLHANVTQRMLEAASGLVAFRTYPHVDMAETGARTMALLKRIFDGETLHLSSRRIPFLIPISAGSTFLEPAQSVYHGLSEHDQRSNGVCSFAAGFPAADFAECGPVVWGYGADRERLEADVARLADEIVTLEARWQVPFLTPKEAVAEAMRLANGENRPVVIADTQDNPGAGGDATTTGMLRALVEADAQDAALGLICDPAAAAKAHAVGEGARILLALGGEPSVGDAPLEAEFEVVRLSDGRCRFDGPMMHGNQVDLGPSAQLKVGGVAILVTSRKSQLLDRNLLRMVGIEPEVKKILVLKSSVHFRADFQPIAAAILIAKSPGPMAADPGELPWRYLEPGIRTRPMGEPFVPPDEASQSNLVGHSE